ncbi:hypothetical protein MKW92_010053 [Papaver armeniacum]|nr:hypothetical protein MKW92_010053 [Papaver armeniacum]
MAAGAVGAVVSVLLGTVTQLLIAEVAFLKGVKKQFELLKEDLVWMDLQVIKANENRKSNDHSKAYADQLRNIIFDVEDVIDRFIARIANHKRSRSIINIPFYHGLGNQILDINVRVEKLRSNKTASGATESSNRDLSSSQKQINERRAEIYKEIRHQKEPVRMYENTARQVIDSLLGDDGDNGKKLRIISIIGMGGVGKTTLAQKIFNDDNVKAQFNCRVFIYISKECCNSQEALINKKKQLLKSLTSIRNKARPLWMLISWARVKIELIQFFSMSLDAEVMCDPANSDDEQDMMNEKIKALLKKQKYLIVIDDVWDTNTWNKLKGAFPDENNGSRVILTTRHKQIALDADKSSIDSNDMYELSAIHDENASWELFLKNYLPFSSSTVGYEAYFSSNLEDLGKKMVEKCHGLPLAIVMLGDLLSSQVKEHCYAPDEYFVWSQVSVSSWLGTERDDSYKCSGIVALSYDYLPYHLQRCFLYMSLLPGNSMIRVTKLIQYWIAEGLISESNREQTLEDTAAGYLKELIYRSLIEVGQRRSDGEVRTCRTHGVLHCISASESTEDKFSQIYDTIHDFNQEKDSSNRRRVAVYCKKRDEHYLSGSNKPPIRSFLCHGDHVHLRKGKYLSSLFGGFKSLRVLELYGETCIDSLPKEVGELIHLRYLSLEKTYLKKFDKINLSKLVHLRTLNLRGNIYANELVLDDHIWCLNRLRHLYLRNIRPAANKKSQKGFDTYPKDLQLLVIQAGDWIHNVELEKLSSLRKLKIEECLRSHSSNITRAVANLTKLRSLALICKNYNGEPADGEQVPVASIQFSTHTSLVKLHLKALIQDWPTVISLFPPNLCKLKLERSLIKKDPMLILEKLRCLRFLHLGFESYRGEEMVCSKGGFARLQTLELVSMLSLKRWIINEGALTSLAHLEIKDCKRLEVSNGFRHLTKVKKLVCKSTPHLHDMMPEIQHIPTRIWLV